jgi:hypothetical protein
MLDHSQDNGSAIAMQKTVTLLVEGDISRHTGLQAAIRIG